jgi:hypothetical protein
MPPATRTETPLSVNDAISFDPATVFLFDAEAETRLH